jgi:hypothetical protein
VCSVGFAQPGHLRQPARRKPRQGLHHALRAGVACQPLERLQQREVHLAFAVKLDAPSPRDPRRLLELGFGQFLEEGPEQARLADPGLAGHEDHLAMPGPSLEKELAQPLQLGFASKEPAAPAWRVRV